MENPINPQYQEYVKDLSDQILSDLDFENSLDLILYLGEQANPMLTLLGMLNKHGWCLYHNIDEEVIPVSVWKSIRESYPQDHQRVLVLTADKEIKIGYLHTPFEDREWSLDNDRTVYGLSHVTDWRELPHNSDKSVDQKEQPEKVRGAFGNL